MSAVLLMKLQRNRGVSLSKRPASQSRGQKSETKPLKPANADLRTELEQQIGPLISGGQREQVISRVMVMMSEQFHGPIAHPRHMREYEEILPGSAERIVQMAEKAQEHNRTMEARIVSAGIWEAKTGMIFGFLALLILIGLGFWAGMAGNNVLAGILLAGGLLGAATTLIRGFQKNGNS